MHPCIYRFIFYTAYPTQGHEKPGAYPKALKAQGRGRSEEGATRLQGTPIHTFSSSQTHLHTVVNYKIASLQHMSLD